MTVSSVPRPQNTCGRSARQPRVGLVVLSDRHDEARQGDGERESVRRSAQQLHGERGALREPEQTDRTRVADGVEPLQNALRGRLDRCGIRAWLSSDERHPERPPRVGAAAERQRRAEGGEHRLEREIGAEREQIALVRAVAVQQDEEGAPDPVLLGGGPQHRVRIDSHRTIIVQRTAAPAAETGRT